jgi:putative oxidoreductase
MLAQNADREDIMAEAHAEPKLALPFLRTFYDSAIPFSWLVVRVAVGWNLLVHGWGKIALLPPSDAVIKAYADLGLGMPAFWFWASFGIETLAGVALIVGLFTRFFAAAATIEMLVITCLYWSNGFGWMHRGYEYVMLWGLVCFAIALRGGGPYSLDRKLGREL